MMKWTKRRDKVGARIARMLLEAEVNRMLVEVRKAVSK